MDREGRRSRSKREPKKNQRQRDRQRQKQIEKGSLREGHVVSKREDRLQEKIAH